MKEIKRIESAELQPLMDKIANAIAERHRETESLVIVGIADGGIPFGQALANRLEKMLGRKLECGSVDISFHRDDLGINPIPKVTFPTNLPFDIDNSTVILTDEVLFTGRTVRAAINELFDQGRPSQVELAILCDRGNRRLPVQADYVGFTESTTITQKVVVELDADHPETDILTILSND